MRTWPARVRSASSATTTSTSISFGFGLVVTIEPSSGNATDTGNLSGGRNEAAQCVEQLLTVTLGGVVHRTLQSSGGTSLSGTNTSIERARPGVRLIKPRRSSVRIML